MILVVGEAVVDVTLHPEDPPKLRLGGIVHACRALWALRVPYRAAVISPLYLRDAVHRYLASHGANNVTDLGTVSGAPNVFLIKEAKEVGMQGYENLLREDHSCTISSSVNDVFNGVEDTLIVPSAYPLDPLISALNLSAACVHIDVANAGREALEACRKLQRSAETLITSTSSEQFQLLYRTAGADVFMQMYEDSGAKSCLYKENRGGALFIDKTQQLSVGAQLRTVAHSVGVGDAYNAAYVAMYRQHGIRAALAYAAWVSAAYAETTYPDDFACEVSRTLLIPSDEIARIPGVRLPWAARESIHIYIAAPDFDYRDVRLINRVFASLQYHNFSPHRPVREHGQASPQSSPHERRLLYAQDLELIQRCSLLVAILEVDDPGTLVEIGIAASLGIPVITLDSREGPMNPMVLGSSSRIVSDEEQLLCAIFELMGTRVGVAEAR